MGYKNKKSEEYHKNYRKKNRKLIREKNRKYREENPWMSTLHNIKQRCNNPNHPDYKNYGGKGIKVLITGRELEELWFRDKAYNLDFPSIDRIESDNDYKYDNCRYIEMGKNSLRMNEERNMYNFYQYDLEGNFIREWTNQTETARILNIDQGSISKCLNGKMNTAGGFKWKKVKK